MKTNIIKKYFLIIITVFFFTAYVSGQKKIEKARDFKENYQYSNALAMYTDYYKQKSPRKSTDIRDIAHCYVMMNDLKSAQDWLTKINSFSIYNSEDILNYAFSLKSLGHYDDAIVQYRRLADIFPEDAEKVPGWIEECYEAKNWIANPSFHETKNVEFLNSENSDFGLIHFKNGYIFSSDRTIQGKNYQTEDIFGWTGNPYLKLFYASDSDIENPEIIDVINSNFHNGPGVYDFSNDILYYTVTSLKKQKSRMPVNSDPTEFEDYLETENYVNRLEIFYSKLENNKWSDVKPFEFNKAEEYSVGHPAVSPDGKILYFASDMPGGYGKSDLYFCIKQVDGSWSTPVNAGNKINTHGKEGFPVVDSTGRLYFSSDGLPGMGGLDIFQSTGEKENWSSPLNLKYPLNSSKDDFSMVFNPDGQSGYLSSNRDGGKGEDDIYNFSRKLIIVGKTLTISAENKMIPLSNVNLTINNKSENLTDIEISDEEGRFSKFADCGEIFEITANKTGYFAQYATADAKCSEISNDTLYVEVIMDKIITNKPYVMENIYYDYNKWNIRPDAAIELDKLVKILRDNPEIEIELGSHTDSRGTFKYNETLSQKRAESAVDYIISLGIGSERITAKGYGENMLRNSCKDGKVCTEEDHQKNRRTEFKVTRIN